MLLVRIAFFTSVKISGIILVTYYKNYTARTICCIISHLSFSKMGNNVAYFTLICKLKP